MAKRGGSIMKKDKQDAKEVEYNTDYCGQIIEIIPKFKNKKLLKRIYDLAEYLYLYEDGK